jgi:redox-sensitive bicupin YhaK (pirin superfamily)
LIFSERNTRPFAYVIDGEGGTDGTFIGDGTLVLYDGGGGLSVQAAGRPLRFLPLTGKPLKEPVAWRGPIVMNAEAESETAYREYQEGAFVRQE